MELRILTPIGLLGSGLNGEETSVVGKTKGSMSYQQQEQYEVRG